MENFVNLENSLLLVVKIGVIFFLLLYIVFAGVVIRQVRVMTETLSVGFEKPVKFIAFIHFIFSLVVFVLALFIL